MSTTNSVSIGQIGKLVNEKLGRCKEPGWKFSLNNGKDLEDYKTATLLKPPHDIPVYCNESGIPKDVLKAVKQGYTEAHKEYAQEQQRLQQAEKSARAANESVAADQEASMFGAIA